MSVSLEFLTVSQLNGLIKEVLNMGFSSGVWVCGEIQGYNRNRDKSHVFFELCEKDPITKDIMARIGLVIFSGRKAIIENTLQQSQNAFQLKDDIEVKFFCKVDFYPPHGAVRLIVEQIDPVYTLGKIAQEKQRLIAFLKNNGTLDRNKKVALPEIPLQIGLITSYDSAAYNDFLSELKLSRFGFKVFCRNTLMQGKAAAEDVCLAILQLNRRNDLDVIVITRGGGSIAELSCFDSQKIAEHIAASRLPVLSGIGHEINITITDLAAHTYQKTPTAIAQFLVEQVSSFLQVLTDRGQTILSLSQSRLDHEHTKLKSFAHDLHAQTHHYLQEHREYLAKMRELMVRLPSTLLKQAVSHVDHQQIVLSKGAQQYLHSHQVRLKHYTRLVDMAKPTKTLKRGFSITRTQEGQLLRHAQDVKSKQRIVTELAQGQIVSEVE